MLTLGWIIPLSPNIHILICRTCECYLLWQKGLGRCDCVKEFVMRRLSWIIWEALNEIKAVVFPVARYRCESWTIKKAECQRIDTFELLCWRRLLRASWRARRSNQSILKEINLSIHWKVNVDAEAEALILWPLDVKSWLTGKDPAAGKDWRQEEKRVTEDEMAAWHHWLNGHEFEQIPEDSEGQGSLEFCSPWGCNKSNTI